MKIELLWLVYVGLFAWLQPKSRKWSAPLLIIGWGGFYLVWPVAVFCLNGCLLGAFSYWLKTETRVTGIFSALLAIVLFYRPTFAAIGILLLWIVLQHEVSLLRLNPISRLLLVIVDVGLLFLALQPGLVSWVAIGLLLAVLCLTQALLAYLYQETDMVYARSLDQIMANYVTEVDQLYQQIRGWRHDYHNHLQTLEAQLASGEGEKAQVYLQELAESLGEIEQIVRSGNPTLDAVVNSKLAIAERNQISTNVKVFVGTQPLSREVDLVVILGNLLDNGIEANLAIPQPEERFLRIYVSILQQQLYFSITNARPLEQEILPEYASTKNDKRGLGIRRINALVEKYQGVINRQYEAGVFVTEVLLPLTTISK